MQNRPVVPKLGGAHRSGARNTENGARKNYGNAPELNYHLMKLSIPLLTLIHKETVQLPVIMQSRCLKIRQS
jgi:hypothetical protein